MRLIELREERNLTQSDVANAINTSRTNIGRWEKGLNEPAANYIILLADFFECSTDYLLGRSDELGVISIRSQTKTPAETLTADEKKLLEMYRKLDVKNKIHVSTYAEIRLEEQSDSKRRA